MHNTDETIILKIFNDTTSAIIAQNKLQEEGIQSFLVNENVMGLNPIGGVELKIFSNDLEKANQLLLS